MGEMIPIFGIFTGIVALCIPIVIVLTNHQRKMAELIHARHNDGVDALRGRMVQMELEMQEMRDRVNAAAIATDEARYRDQHLNV
jgi:hypothetical protein